ncbi:hypothetical protein PIB30_004997 [Stylosanthes scabra]|uniref:Uncharacterized protein n=1 Tax=Stylosanthes scabra TaxID=79078 RepID=A0ABU6Y3Y4_9FABA|nr:hypothetical protein [Stylosanthes scabra]
MKRRENSKRKTKGIWRAHACTKAPKGKGHSHKHQKGRQGDEKLKIRKALKKNPCRLKQQSCGKTTSNASATQLKEEVHVMKTKWGHGNRIYTAAWTSEMKGKSRKAGIGWELRAFLTRYTDS